MNLNNFVPVVTLLAFGPHNKHYIHSDRLSWAQGTSKVSDTSTKNSKSVCVLITILTLYIVYVRKKKSA